MLSFDNSQNYVMFSMEVLLVYVSIKSVMCCVYFVCCNSVLLIFQYRERLDGCIFTLFDSMHVSIAL